MHNLTLLYNVAIALVVAFVGGLLARRIGLPTIVGYGRVGRPIVSLLQQLSIPALVALRMAGSELLFLLPCSRMSAGALGGPGPCRIGIRNRV